MNISTVLAQSACLDCCHHGVRILLNCLCISLEYTLGVCLDNRICSCGCVLCYPAWSSIGTVFAKGVCLFVCIKCVNCCKCVASVHYSYDKCCENSKYCVSVVSWRLLFRHLYFVLVSFARLRKEKISEDIDNCLQKENKIYNVRP